jgi:hypothetical protein
MNEDFARQLASNTLEQMTLAAEADARAPSSLEQSLRGFVVHPLALAALRTFGLTQSIFDGDWFNSARGRFSLFPSLTVAPGAVVMLFEPIW